jgi:dolichol-phosphate mannosyltransferase
MKNKISIIVPTYKEAKNIPVLAEKINSALKKHKLGYEIIIVDDNSRDGIENAVIRLKKKYPVTLKVRVDERGLSSAVIEGFRIAKGDVFVVMDADLSHPPEKIPELIGKILNDGAEFVVGSRFVEGGSALHFDWYRKLNAWISKMLARPFTSVKDPMAGFFAFPKSILTNLEELNPLGFKIGLEVIVKCKPRKVVEIPIQFQERLYGESKLSFKEQVLYLFHLRRLFMYKYRHLAEFIQFALIGGIGMMVDLFFVFLSYGILSLPFRLPALSDLCLHSLIIFCSTGGSLFLIQKMEISYISIFLSWQSASSDLVLTGQSQYISLSICLSLTDITWSRHLWGFLVG